MCLRANRPKTQSQKNRRVSICTKLISYDDSKSNSNSKPDPDPDPTPDYDSVSIPDSAPDLEPDPEFDSTSDSKSADTKSESFNCSKS
jgi:hypothetical protein